MTILIKKVNIENEKELEEFLSELDIYNWEGTNYLTVEEATVKEIKENLLNVYEDQLEEIEDYKKLKTDLEKVQYMLDWFDDNNGDPKSIFTANKRSPKGFFMAYQE